MRTRSDSPTPREERFFQGMKSTVKWVGGMAFDATTSSQHTVRLDASADIGGENGGPRPMEMLLVGLGGCTGMDVMSMLKKMRQDVTGYEVNVSGERATGHPKIFTSIVVEHVVRGRGVSEDAVRKAISLSEKKYCSVGAMLGKAARVEHRQRIVEETEATAADVVQP
jgi:putative redox protein